MLRGGFGNNYGPASPLTTLRNDIPAGALDDVPTSLLTPIFGDRGTPFETSLIRYLDPNRKQPTA
jgi:hypothetical protein